MKTRSRRRGRTALLLGWAAFAAVQPATADEAAMAAQVGPRVRVTTAKGRCVGRLVTIRDEILLIERSGGHGTLEIRRPGVLALEISGTIEALKKKLEEPPPEPAS